MLVAVKYGSILLLGRAYSSVCELQRFSYFENVGDIDLCHWSALYVLDVTVLHSRIVTQEIFFSLRSPKVRRNVFKFSIFWVLPYIRTI